jgi:hypothetical protein
MRFLYGFILGILSAVIAAILYLALGGGDYLLVLSPTYHEMKSSIDSLQRAAQQRDQLAGKLDDLEKRFSDLSRRFAELHAASKSPTPEGAEAAQPSQ